MTRDGYVARWQGTECEASPSADGDVRLYTSEPLEGFQQVRPGRYRRCVPLAEIDDLRYVRTTCVWRGEPFIVVGEHESWLRLEYTGKQPAIAENLGLENVDRGVWQAWAQRSEVEELRTVYV